MCSPRVECFDSQTDQDLFALNTIQETGLEFRNLSDPLDLAVYTANVRRADARNAVLVQRCHETSGKILRHVGTATVVRDLEYMSRLIEGENAPVNFWGFSYGTIIGNYFVNMWVILMEFTSHPQLKLIKVPPPCRSGDHRRCPGNYSESTIFDCYLLHFQDPILWSSSYPSEWYKCMIYFIFPLLHLTVHPQTSLWTLIKRSPIS